MSFLAALCASLTLSAAAADPARHMLPDAEQGAFAAVGRLNVTGQGFCSATLIAPDLVLTAAHCVVDRRTRRVVAPARVHFLAGFRVGTFAAHGVGAEIEVSAGYSPDQRNIARDIALVRLRAPLPAEIVPFPVETGIRADRRITLVSYGMDRSQIASVQRNCGMRHRVGATIYTDCEGLPGVSGAPLLQDVDGRLTLVAVASAVITRTSVANPRGDVLAAEATGQGLHRLRRGVSRSDVLAMR